MIISSLKESDGVARVRGIRGLLDGGTGTAVDQRLGTFGRGGSVKCAVAHRIGSYGRDPGWYFEGFRVVVG